VFRSFFGGLINSINSIRVVVGLFSLARGLVSHFHLEKFEITCSKLLLSLSPIAVAHGFGA
jgi:hypothetical protein